MALFLNKNNQMSYSLSLILGIESQIDRMVDRYQRKRQAKQLKITRGRNLSPAKRVIH